MNEQALKYGKRCIGTTKGVERKETPQASDSGGGQGLYDCGLIHQVFCVKAPKYPLKAYQEYTAFKLFAVDVGLLSAMNGIDAETLLHGNAIFTEFKGALTEQYVFQQLVQQHEPYYWAKSNSQSEAALHY